MEPEPDLPKFHSSTSLVSTAKDGRAKASLCRGISTAVVIPPSELAKGLYQNQAAHQTRLWSKAGHPLLITVQSTSWLLLLISKGSRQISKVCPETPWTSIGIEVRGGWTWAGVQWIPRLAQRYPSLYGDWYSGGEFLLSCSMLGTLQVAWPLGPQRGILDIYQIKVDLAA